MLIGRPDVPKEIDDVALAELLSIGYVTGNDTFFRGIRTVDLGEYVELGPEPSLFRRSVYYEYIHDKADLDREVFFETAFCTLEAAFRRMLLTIPAGSQVAIPLSGGNDSRLLACLCRKFGLRNVVCFTYGRSDSFEVAVSRRVTERLGFEWHYVPYSPERFIETFDSDCFRAFSEFCTNCNTIPHIQDFIAVRTLLERGVLKPHAVVVPGHMGDLPAGAKMPREVLAWPVGKCTAAACAELLYRRYYDLNPLEKSAAQAVVRKIGSALNPNEIHSPDTMIDRSEQWIMKNRTAKFILNSVRTYEFFGLDWRIPLGDSQYTALWYRVPWRDKTPDLLQEFVSRYYFVPYGVDFAPVAESFRRKGLMGMAKSVVPRKMQPRLSALVRRIFRRNSNDFNAFAATARLLYARCGACPAKLPVRKWDRTSGNAINSMVARMEVQRSLVRWLRQE